MKIFKVYIDKKSENPLEEAVFIKSGFSLPAFLFGILWVLYHKLWKVAGVLILIQIALTLLYKSSHIQEMTYVIISNLVLVYLAFDASDIQENDLSAKSYILQSIVSAPNLDQAKINFFEEVKNRANSNN
jgi:hypothetical protein